jgi:Spy/CpxP family protein refolding chaperone
MKSIQKFSTAVIAVIILSTGLVLAQPGKGGNDNRPNPEERQERMLDRLAYELKLSDDQRAKVNEIYGKHFEEMKKVREEEQKRFEELRKKHDEKRAEVAEEVKKELTEEQQQKFDELQERFEARRGDGKRGKGHRGNGPRGRF